MPPGQLSCPGLLGVRWVLWYAEAFICPRLRAETHSPWKQTCRQTQRAHLNTELEVQGQLVTAPPDFLLTSLREMLRSKKPSKGLSCS